jgi:hypothetical protein
MKYLNSKNIICTILFSFLLFSCTTEENEVIDKELTVKNLLTEYVNVVNNQPKYADFFNKAETYSKSSLNNNSTSEEELLNLLSTINPEFLNLYEKVQGLNLTKEEFLEIANNYENLLSSNMDSYSAKKVPFQNAIACGVSSAISIVSVLGWLGVWAHCGPE